MSSAGKLAELMVSAALLLAPRMMLAQGAPAPIPPAPSSPPAPRRPPVPPEPERDLLAGLPGRWWNDPRMVRELGLSSDQQKRMDTVFTQNRMKLIDLTAELQKQELVLEPMLAADHPDATRAGAQIDRVAQCRAELEKANGRMLLHLREVLTVAQWRHLQAQTPGPPHPPGNR